MGSPKYLVDMYTSIGFIILGIFLGNVFKRSKKTKLEDIEEEKNNYYAELISAKNDISELRNQNLNLRKMIRIMKIALLRSKSTLSEQDVVIRKLVSGSSSSGKTPSC